MLRDLLVSGGFKFVKEQWKEKWDILEKYGVVVITSIEDGKDIVHFPSQLTKTLYICDTKLDDETLFSANHSIQDLMEYYVSHLSVFFTFSLSN